jgi:hypothetical protein
MYGELAMENIKMTRHMSLKHIIGSIRTCLESKMTEDEDSYSKTIFSSPRKKTGGCTIRQGQLA